MEGGFTFDHERWAKVGFQHHGRRTTNLGCPSAFLIRVIGLKGLPQTYVRHMGVIALAAEYLSAAFPTGVGPNRGSAIHAHTNGWLIPENDIGFSTQTDRIMIHLLTSMGIFGARSCCASGMQPSQISCP